MFITKTCLNNLNNTKQNNNVNFSSKINLVDSRIFFYKYNAALKPLTEVRYPLSPIEMQKGINGLAEGIKDCTAGGIITKNANGSRDVVMFHLNPCSDECLNTDMFKDAFIKKIAKATPLQALLIGSSDNKTGILKRNEKFFDAIEKMIKRTFKIPVSKLKGIPAGACSVDALYEGYKDEWTIWNSKRDNIPPNSLDRKSFTGFSEIKLSKIDKLTLDEE